MYCTCVNVGASKDRIGFHRREDGIWTHALCERPSRLYLKGLLERMPTDLNLFQDGPLHNVMLDNEEIQDRKAVLAHGQHVLDNIDDYRWTDETLAGQSGKVARIWRPKEESWTTAGSTTASASIRSSRVARSRQSRR